MSNNKRVYLYYYKLRRIETFIATSVKEDYVFIAGIRYSRKSSSAIIFDDKGKLIEYLDNKYEKEIDSMTVSIGLGQQLYTWSYYVLYKSKGSKKYKAYKKLVYLEPEEILKLIEEHETSN